MTPISPREEERRCQTDRPRCDPVNLPKHQPHILGKEVTETSAIGVPVQQGLQPYPYILANYLMTNRARWAPTESTVCGWTCLHYAAREGRGMGPGQLCGACGPPSWPAGSRGPRVGSVNTSAVMSIHTLA